MNIPPLNIPEEKSDSVNSKLVSKDLQAAGGGANLENKNSIDTVNNNSLAFLDIPQSLETNIALGILSKLNLPITAERINIIIDLLKYLEGAKNQEFEGFTDENPQTQSQNLLFYKAVDSWAKAGPSPLETQLLKYLEGFSPASKDKEMATENHVKEGILKDYLAAKVLNAANNPINITTDEKAYFFIIELPVYQKIYIRISHEILDSARQQAFVKLSFIVNTKNLGAVLIELTYLDGAIKAASTFESKKSLDYMKNFLTASNNTSALVRNMEFKVGKISLENFLFDKAGHSPLKGINIKI